MRIWWNLPAFGQETLRKASLSLEKKGKGDPVFRNGSFLQSNDKQTSSKSPHPAVKQKRPQTTSQCFRMYCKNRQTLCFS
mmetsp:Transcript_20310/g.24889  ORF Transcript_20310/g.24889 Transcript_20310/m.24889 type:complete len:80 (+) Transcript_20310:52-291(+)